jgi:hypothetical protein
MPLADAVARDLGRDLYLTRKTRSMTRWMPARRPDSPGPGERATTRSRPIPWRPGWLGPCCGRARRPFRRPRLARDHLADIRAPGREDDGHRRPDRGRRGRRGHLGTSLSGIGPVIAGRLLAETGDVARFATKDKFASDHGTAPIGASSGEQARHRLSRAGNRRNGHALHMMAVTQIRYPGTKRPP